MWHVPAYIRAQLFCRMFLHALRMQADTPGNQKDGSGRQGWLLGLQSMVPASPELLTSKVSPDLAKHVLCEGSLELSAIMSLVTGSAQHMGM